MKLSRQQVNFTSSGSDSFDRRTEDCAAQLCSWPTFLLSRESELTTLRRRSGFLSGLVGREPTIEMTWVVPLPAVEIILDNDRFHSASLSCLK